MAIPTSREEFKEHCLRRLGAPVIEINVADEQVEDRIDEALKYYADYHFDGAEKLYYKVEITDQIKTERYITLPQNIIGAVRVFPMGAAIGSGDMFNIQYQIALNDLYTLSAQSMIPYYMTMQHIALLEELLVGQKPIRYNRHMNRLYIDMNWNRVNTGSYIVVEAYQVIDPEQYQDVWGDRWLQRYCTALIQQSWGRNLTKFTGMKLIGGVEFNGEKILEDANEQISKLESQMLESYSLPVSDMMG